MAKVASQATNAMAAVRAQLDLREKGAADKAANKANDDAGAPVRASSNTKQRFVFVLQCACRPTGMFSSLLRFPGWFLAVCRAGGSVAWRGAADREGGRSPCGLSVLWCVERRGPGREGPVCCARNTKQL